MPPGNKGMTGRIAVCLVFDAEFVEQSFGVFAVFVGDIFFATHGNPEEL
jgi:hypothetical protein